jgi:hypothetical protein
VSDIPRDQIPGLAQADVRAEQEAEAAAKAQAKEQAADDKPKSSKS